MLLAPALLLFTTLTSVGLIAAWAATSARHWFVRTMGFLAVASLPLLIPAYEMFVAFVLQGLVVAVGVQACRWRRDRADGKGARFALRDALLAVVPLAWVFAAFAAQEEVVFLDLLSPAMVGVAFGLVSLLSMWASRGGLRRWSLALLSSGIVAVPLAFFEQTLPEFCEMLEWTYDGEHKLLDVLVFSTDSFDVHLEWLVVSIGVAVTVGVLSWLCSLGTPANARPSSQRRFATGATLALLTAAPSLYMLVRLTHPTPIPEYTLPDPNGFEDYLLAANALPASPTVDDTWAFDVDTATTPQLQAAVAEIDQALELVRSGVAKKVLRSPTYTMDDLDVPDFGGFRTLSRGFIASGKLNEAKGRASDAVDDYLTVLDYGCSLTRGGLMVDTLIGVACGGMSVEPLRELKPSAPRERLSDIVARIAAAELRIDAIDQIVLRDKVWSQRAMGWDGHLYEILSTLGGPSWASETFRVAYYRNLATLRLLRLEYAVEIYQRQHGKLPETLDQLAPEILEAIPSDPFAGADAPLRYRRTEDGYQVYSIWADGVDDVGKPPEATDGTIYWGADNPGDLSLDALYWKPPPPPAPVDNEELRKQMEEITNRIFDDADE